MLHMREQILRALLAHAQGDIAKHKVNINNLLDNHVALAEHPDIIETLDKEIEMLSSYEDKLQVLDKYFVGKKTGTKELLKD